MLVLGGCLLAAAGLWGAYAWMPAQQEAAPEANIAGSSDDELDRLREGVRTDLLPAYRVYLHALLSAKHKDAGLAAEKCKQIEARLEPGLQRLLSTMEKLRSADPRPLAADDLPETIPAVYRARLLNVLEYGSPELVAQTVQSVVEEWDAALKVTMDAAVDSLVPNHPYTIAGWYASSYISDSWLDKPAEQRVANLYVSKLLRKVYQEWKSLRYAIGYYGCSKEVEEMEEFLQHARDHRYLLALLLLNQAHQESLAILFRDAYPDMEYAYELPDEVRPGLIPCLEERLAQEDSFVQEQHALLLQDYFYDEEDETKSAAEIRKEVEHMLEVLRQRMEKVYETQKRFLCVAYSSYADDGPGDDFCLEGYEKSLAKVRAIFVDDLRILRRYAHWVPEEKEGDCSDVPAPPMRPVAIPSFMVCTTHGEGEYLHMYRRAGDAVRADVRRAYTDALAHGYELLLGGPMSHENIKSDLRLDYMKSLLDDAEYAWLRYVCSIYDLMEPLLRCYYGSGTGIFISHQMSNVYENHSRYYTDVLRIHPATDDSEGEQSEDSEDCEEGEEAEYETEVPDEPEAQDEQDEPEPEQENPGNEA